MSKLLSNSIRTAIAAFVALTVFDASAAQSGKSPAAQFGKTLTAFELYQLYQGRSWIWEDGAGYFSPKERRFTSWTGSGKNASYGEGRWFLTDQGKLCFRATWVAKDGSAPALTCFSHRKKGGNVYQKREPNGDWYLFKQAPIRKADEYAKVRPGDFVSDRYTQVKKQLSRKS
jgi:hypothetical protein